MAHAQLNLPMSIWQSATAQEKDDFFLNAGFDPNIAVIDNGTDGLTVRLTQASVPGFPHQVAAEDVSEIPGTFGLQAGDDLRDFQTVSLTGDNPITDEFGVAVGSANPGTALAIAGRALRLIMGGGGGRLLAASWNSLPSVARSALTQVGIGVGALIAFNGDIPFITLPGQGDPSSEGAIVPGGRAVDIQVGVRPQPMMGVQVVGSWNTNPKNPELGVTFYRLSNGWLAVQNKKGRWKTWKPKRPIVMYASGASDLKTMLRADKALNKQAKKIDAMLNRRVRRRRTPQKPAIIVESGPGSVIAR